jgi:lipoprotein-anchoring transpeptidase ErfK/SrfK
VLLRVLSWFIGGCVCVVLIAMLFVGARKTAETRAATDRPPAPANLRSTPAPMLPPAPTPQPAPLTLPLVAPHIVVSKSRRQLELYSDGHVVRTYTVALGLSPVDDKERQGDRRTPEGDFYVCMKNDRSQFYLSLGLSYPNEEDAERGLRDKLITQAQHDAIVRASQHKQTPPWNTPLGGEVMLHGGGTGTDWTWGCVALANADIKELFAAVPNGTPVRIEH